MAIINSTIFLTLILACQSFCQDESHIEEPSSSVSGIQRSRGFPVIPDGYQVIPGIGAIQINRRRVPWNEARNLCIQQGAHLAVINSLAEEYVIRQMVAEAGISTSVWLGAHDIFQENDWATVQDIPLQSVRYVGWAPGEPDNLSKIYAGRRITQNCLCLFRIGGFDDDYCENPFPFVCKIQIP